MRAVVMERFGGPEVLRMTRVPEPEPGPTQELVEVSRAGVNWADVHARTNSALAPVELPHVPGSEVIGRTADGRRVLGLTASGGYAERALIERRMAWEVPEDISDDEAVPLAVQGQAAWHLLFTMARVRPGQRVLVPAAAGSLGSIAVQLAAEAGARVIGLASTEQRRQLVRSLGAEAAVDSSPDGLAERVREAAGGPVEVALEMTGGAVLTETISALAPRGRLVIYGSADGRPGELPIRVLMERSITVSTFWLPHLLSAGAGPPASLVALFDAVRRGTLRPMTGGVYPLAEAGAAHRALAARTHLGKLSLSPSR
ncbi:zinc-binding alcohol dehydrogenase family protein [Streptomyces sp. DSM 44915]|uniref:Zinc-binding alcohol dehydrogenase family protein n=1 Tax=Streptomyces chisholmiae TaxID=3075540 RepID=A0ABU2JV97_9ACTN|nr:zinc-binding alcohol dehydrogenase family protein [Streptomyces sp. DSM 44915]MDT0268474.1 zinc-binding alcohol dehydrogenase family protein [Streptomyces sp. DSM 44915]